MTPVKKKIFFGLVAVITLAVVLLVAGLCCYELSGNSVRALIPRFTRYVGDNYIGPVDYDTPGVGAKYGLDEFKLVLSASDIAHFSDLYSKFEDDAYGVKYYAKHNQWRKAILRVNGEEYKVRIKSHGRNPSEHRVGNYISFAVKVRKGEAINNATRFSLIVRNRISLDAQWIMALANEYGLISQSDEFVSVNINNWPGKIYYFEKRLDDAYMEFKGKSSRRIFGYNISDIVARDKSSIICTERDVSMFDESAYRLLFKQVMNESDVLPVCRDDICERYIEFNKAIAGGDVQEVLEYFDLDYISSYEAVRAILGCNGHAFVRGNLTVYYDAASGEFWPAFTRDHGPADIILAESQSLENRLNWWVSTGDDWATMRYTRSPMFELVSRNDRVRQETYRKIYGFYAAGNAHGFPDFERAKEINRNARYFGPSLNVTLSILRKIGLLGPKSYYVNDGIIDFNVSVLKSYLEKSMAKYSVGVSDSSVLVKVLPKSMSALAVREFFLNFKGDGKRNHSEETGRARGFSVCGGVTNILCEKDVKIKFDQNGADLSEAFNGMLFSTAIGAESDFLPREYYVVIDFDGELLREVSEDDVSLGFVNTISGIPLKANCVTTFDGPPVFSVPDLVFESDYKIWRDQNSDLNVVLDDGGNIVLRSGIYSIDRDVVFPEGKKLIIEAGTRIMLGEKRALLVKNGIEVRGTEQDPVTITSIDKGSPFGSVGVLGGNQAISRINYLNISNGSERSINGVYLSGGLSVHYNKEVYMTKCEVSENHADDGVNIKYSAVIIDQCKFINNAADSVDLDACSGYVKNSLFVNSKPKVDLNGDGLDVSFSSVIVSHNEYSGFQDKGISVGEKSQMMIFDNTFVSNSTGVAVKDLSEVFFRDNRFAGNSLDIHAFQKKAIFGGGSIYFPDDRQALGGLKYSLDSRSELGRYKFTDDLDKFAHDGFSTVQEYFNLLRGGQLENAQ